jgi:hypothetical protein
VSQSHSCPADAAGTVDLPHATACFSVSAVADSGLLPRLLQPFAKRGLTPTALYARQHGEDVSVDIQIDGLGQEDAAMIGRGLRQIFGVDVVLVSQRVSAERLCIAPPPRPR